MNDPNTKVVATLMVDPFSPVMQGPLIAALQACPAVQMAAAAVDTSGMSFNVLAADPARPTQRMIVAVMHKKAADLEGATE